ncbi:unnamed protein product, partial [Didymodactylos carnosus]
MLGSVFRIKSVEFDHNKQFWISHLELCSDNDHDLNKIYCYIKQNISDKTDLITLAYLLFEMGEYDNAEKFIKQMLNEVSYYDCSPKTIVECYNCLGQIAEQKRDLKQASDYYEKAMAIKIQSLPPSHPTIARSYGQIGSICLRNDNNQLAYDYFTKALNIFMNSTQNADYDLDIAECYNSIGNVYNNEEKYDLALINYEKSLRIKKNVLPIDHY